MHLFRYLAAGFFCCVPISAWRPVLRDADACLTADVFVIGALVRVLEPSHRSLIKRGLQENFTCPLGRPNHLSQGIRLNMRPFSLVREVG